MARMAPELSKYWNLFRKDWKIYSSLSIAQIDAILRYLLMADVVERMRQDAAARRRARRGHTLPARRSRLNLLHTAVVGPVLTDMYIAARPLGDG